MKYQIYVEILKAVDEYRFDPEWLSKISEIFSQCTSFTISSIYAQDMKKKVKKSYHRMTHPEVLKEFYQRYHHSTKALKQSGIIFEMAKENVFSPAMMAKILLEHHVNQIGQNQGIESNISKSHINKLLRNTNLIGDSDLAYEIYMCLLQDDVYGPYADSIKHSIGHEYEFLLRSELEKLDIGYINEDVLRNRGYDKTPDIKLDVPIAIDGGHVINWIESKASFGDEESHKSYLKDQFWSYWNRFGPGLVIYWFGFIEELDTHSACGIVLKDHFPTQITFMESIPNKKSST